MQISDVPPIRPPAGTLIVVLSSRESPGDAGTLTRYGHVEAYDRLDRAVMGQVTLAYERQSTSRESYCLGLVDVDRRGDPVVPRDATGYERARSRFLEWSRPILTDPE